MQQTQIRRTASSTSQPNEEQPLVMIVDDDAAIREALHELLLSAGMQPACFASTRDLSTPVCPRGRVVSFSTCACLVQAASICSSSRDEGKPQADHFSYRAWRHPDDCASHEAGRRRLPHEASAGPDVARRRNRRHREGRCTERGPARQKHIERLATLTPREREVFAEVGRPQQADRLRPRHQRGYRQTPPRQCHAEDAGRFGRRTYPRLGSTAR